MIAVLYRSHWRAIVFSLLALAIPAGALFADTDNQSFLSILQTAKKNASPVINQDIATAMRGLKVNHDDITLDQLQHPHVLNTQAHHQAQVWGLTDKEEARYLDLMDNKSGLRYQHLHLSPVEVLGLNAINAQQRAHFAEKEAQLQTEKITRELAWSQAYKVAMTQLLQGLPRVLPFDMSPYSPYNYQPVLWQPNDKLVVFLSIKTPFQNTMNTLIDNLEKTPDFSVVLLFIDKNITNERLDSWAHSHDIPPILVNTKRIQLNAGDPQYQSWQKSKATRKNSEKLPIILLIRNGESQEIPVSRF